MYLFKARNRVNHPTNVFYLHFESIRCKSSQGKINEVNYLRYNSNKWKQLHDYNRVGIATS